MEHMEWLKRGALSCGSISKKYKTVNMQIRLEVRTAMVVVSSVTAIVVSVKGNSTVLCLISLPSARTHGMDRCVPACKTRRFCFSYKVGRKSSHNSVSIQNVRSMHSLSFFFLWFQYDTHGQSWWFIHWNKEVQRQNRYFWFNNDKGSCTYVWEIHL